jgi:hypothetical protein
MGGSIGKRRVLPARRELRRRELLLTCLNGRLAIGLSHVFRAYQIVDTDLLRRIRSSAVTSGQFSIIAVAVMIRSAGSFGKSDGKRTASDAISGVSGVTPTRETVSRTNDSTLPGNKTRPFSANHANSHRVMPATVIPVACLASRIDSRARLESRGGSLVIQINT